MDEAQVDAYLARIGMGRPVRADAAALRELQHRHLLAVPFENLSIHLGGEIVLEERALLDKVVGQRRGGFCYELNGVFAALLTALGFDVTLLAARVHTPAGLGPPFDHLTLRVATPEPWLVDVGFGRNSQYPVRLDVRDDQTDPDGTFRITPLAEGDIDVSKDGEPQYRIESRGRTLGEFEPTCWWHQTSPKSPFTRSLVCSMLTDSGRVTLSDRTFIRTTGDQRDEEVLTSDDEVLATYRTEFGVVLERLPAAPAPAPR